MEKGRASPQDEGWVRMSAERPGARGPLALEVSPGREEKKSEWALFSYAGMRRTLACQEAQTWLPLSVTGTFINSHVQSHLQPLSDGGDGAQEPCLLTVSR